jgi:thiol-disulfide isomerase/thioredoxin
MVRWLTLLTFVIAALLLPLPGTDRATAQEAPACAGTFWLEPLTDAAEPAAATPAWLNNELTDACSGTTFSLADFAGKTIYVEAMATWCPPCRDQLGRVKEAAAQIPEGERADVFFVALSSEVDLPRETLAEYATTNDFPFIFAVMPAEMLQAMADDLGQEIAVPPATPHLIVAADGTVGALRTGSDSAEDLLPLLTAP